MRTLPLIPPPGLPPALPRPRGAAHGRLAGAGLALGLACVAATGQAQTWPARPLTVVVPFAAGGPVAPSNYGTLRLQAGGVELPVQVAGPRGREMVREFEKALQKERLVRGR